MDERGPPPSSVSGFVATNIESAVPSSIYFFYVFSEIPVYWPYVEEVKFLS